MDKSLQQPEPLSFSQRIRRTETPIIDALLEQYKDDARVIYNLAPGSFSCGMSKAAQVAAVHALGDPKQMKDICSYGDVLGWLPLRTRWLASILTTWDTAMLHENSTRSGSASATDYGLELMITAGANQAFMNIVLALCDPGDEVLLVLPYYFSHLNALTMTGATPVLVPCDVMTFLPTLEDIKRRTTARTKALVLVNPGNPSGAVIPKNLLDAIVTFCRNSSIWLIIDEAYKEFVFEPSFCPHYSPPVVEGVIKMYTMSKVYGLAGWRVGAVLYPRALSEQMRKVQDTIPTHSCRLSDWVAHAALAEEVAMYDIMDSVSARISSAKEIRDEFLQALRPVYQTSGLRKYFMEPNGAFYLFLPIAMPAAQSATAASKDSDVVEVLVEKCGTLVTPGEAFGMPNYIRVAYGAISREVAPAAAKALAHGTKNYLSSCGLML